MAEESLKEFPSVRVAVVHNEYVADYAARNSIGFLVRGLRDGGDLEFERKLCHGNRIVNPSVESVFMMCDQEMQLVSSSAVQQWVGPIGWVRHVARMVPPPVLKALVTRSVSERWRTFASEFGVPHETARTQFAALRRQYENRPYHNFFHTLALLETIESGRCPVEDRPAMTLAVWYHDLFVDSDDKGERCFKSPEVRSAEHLESLTEWQPVAVKAARLVMATQHGNVHGRRSSDEKVIAGIDLLVLAQVEASYREYVAHLREEYAWASDADFNAGRVAFLRRMLRCSRIFPRMPCFKADETRARDNMQAELTERLATPKSAR
jgi:predicted metal-dependent HD superfamily phosphohydrolase